jgi:hypothetical protein
MNTINRIRYVKTQDPDVMVAKKILYHPTSGAQYRVQLNMRDLKWQVLDYMSSMVVCEGTATHPHKLKIGVRNALVELGVQLQMETREKRVATATDDSDLDELDIA